MPVQFSNPRLYAEFTDWPMGGNKRGKCVFAAEFREKNGWRVGRTTTGATKYNTYSDKIAIVDGDNGRTYILTLSRYGGISISGSDFKNPGKDELGMDHYITPEKPEYSALLVLIQKANEDTIEV